MTRESLPLLLDKLCQGDPEAAEQVFKVYEPYLRKIVRRQLPDRLRAKFDSLDIVQSVWLDVLAGFRDAGWRFRDAEHLRAFLVKATRHRFIDRYRQHRRALEREIPLSCVKRPSAQPRPSEVVRANDLWERLLALCPPEHHEVLQLKRDGLSAGDIAARVGLHEDSVRRILRQLAQKLALQEGLSPPSDRVE
jgi:RNA polymerase sigma-70 factor (ECF subfamily)